MIKVRINLEADRLAVGAILLKNGYRVEQVKERKPGTKAMVYYLVAEDTKGGGKE
jgi:hypothetical protein